MTECWKLAWPFFFLLFSFCLFYFYSDIMLCLNFSFLAISDRNGSLWLYKKWESYTWCPGEVNQNLRVFCFQIQTKILWVFVVISTIFYCLSVADSWQSWIRLIEHCALLVEWLLLLLWLILLELVLFVFASCFRFPHLMLCNFSPLIYYIRTTYNQEFWANMQSSILVL